MKEMGHFLIVNPFMHTFGMTSLELNMAPGVLLEPYMSQGGQGVTETPIVSKGLRSGWAGTTQNGKISKTEWK